LRHAAQAAQADDHYPITCDCDVPDLPTVQCMPVQISQVMSHLLRNAAQASPTGARALIKAELGDEQVIISVTDQGCGIAADNLSRIFEPFFTTWPVGQGQGLGLSLAYNIVQQHHGRMGVASEPGKGCRMTVMLPIQPTQVSPPERFEEMS
jgi:two-component system NtrC family sensor kinase